MDLNWCPVCEQHIPLAWEVRTPLLFLGWTSYEYHPDSNMQWIWITNASSSMSRQSIVEPLLLRSLQEGRCPCLPVGLCCRIPRTDGSDGFLSWAQPEELRLVSVILAPLFAHPLWSQQLIDPPFTSNLAHEQLHLQHNLGLRSHLASSLLFGPASSDNRRCRL